MRARKAIAISILAIESMIICMSLWGNVPVWHDTGTIQSIGHPSTWFVQSQRWSSPWNVTFTTMNHGTITVIQKINCTALCDSVDWTSLRIGETVGITYLKAGQYGLLRID